LLRVKIGGTKMNKIGVLGTGTMGAGIIQVLAQSGYEVVLRARRESSVEKGIATVGKNLDKLVAKEKITAADKDAVMARIQGSTSPYFDQIVISGDFGKGKPDPSIFEHALSLMGLNKEEVLMVGDNLMTDILGANRAGIKSIWVNRHNKERNEVIPTFEITHLSELFEIIEKLNLDK
jgi:ribonucleotide monophosphatase NagD (HAD superfamily)